MRCGGGTGHSKKTSVKSKIWVRASARVAKRSLYSRPRKKYHTHQVPAYCFTINEVLGRIPLASLLVPAVTNARFASLHGLLVAPSPSRRRPFHSANRALVTSLNGAGPQVRRASVCGSAAGVALRLRFARRSSPLSAPRPRSPTADRSLLNWIFHAPFGAVRLGAPTIPACEQLLPPERILWAGQ